MKDTFHDYLLKYPIPYIGYSPTFAYLVTSLPLFSPTKSFIDLHHA